MALDYQYWKHKKTDETYAVKLKDGVPFRKTGPLREVQYLSSDGRLLHHKLERYHYDRRFEDDPYRYTVCDGVPTTEPAE